MKIKKEVKKWIMTSSLALLSAIFGFYCSEFTKDYRENFSKGRLKIVFEDNENRLKLILNDSKSDKLTLNEIK